MNKEIIEEVYTAEVEHIRNHTLSVLFDLVENNSFTCAFAETYRSQFFTLFTNRLATIDGNYVYPTSEAYELVRMYKGIMNTI